MSIYSEVFPSCGTPDKHQMEALFNSIRPESITDAVVKDFGLVKEEGGEWRIGVPLHRARALFADFYKTLDATDKLLFQMPFLSSGFVYVRSIMENMVNAGAHDVYGHIAQVSQIQSAVIQAVMPFIQDEMARRYGLAPQTGE